ncbi:MAG: hypothetical protein HXS54_08460 [Theionarchaea archaeon]|nr:hypothetical protein [Theionarchaea archaeon]
MQSVLSVVVLVLVVQFIIGIMMVLYFLTNHLITYLIKYYEYWKKESELKNKYPYSYYILSRIQEKRRNPMILHNFLREFVFQNIERTAFHQAIGTLEQHLGEKKYQTENRIYEIPGEIIKFLKENVEGDCPFFLGHEIQDENIPEYVCHYKVYKDFWNYCIKKTSELFSDTNQVVRNRKEEIREKLRKNEKIPLDNFGGRNLSGEHGFFWVCKKMSDATCSCDDGKAQTIADRLGFVLEEEDDLVEICIPKSKIKKLSCPTIFDNAFKNDYFRTQYRKDMWGETVNLSPNPGKEFEGYPEAISRSIPVEKTSSQCIIGRARKNDRPPSLKDIFKESCKRMRQVI